VTLNCIGDAVACTDISGNISFLNLVAEKMTGWSLQEADGHPMAEILQILDAANRQTIPDPMEMVVGQNRSMHLPADCVLIRRDGFEIPIEDSVAPIHDREGRPTGAVIVFRDVSAARAMAEQMTHSAQHDYLTGLPNARSLFLQLDRELARCKRDNSTLTVMVGDMDGFKQINDRFGHLEGNRVLRLFAQALKESCREYDYVARMGGDEFVVIAPGLPADASTKKAYQLRELAKQAGFEVCAEEILSLSVGQAMYPQDGTDAEELLAEADRRMYKEKRDRQQASAAPERRKIWEASWNATTLQ